VLGAVVDVHAISTNSRDNKSDPHP